MSYDQVRPGWEVTSPDGTVVDWATSTVAAEMTATANEGGGDGSDRAGSGE